MSAYKHLTEKEYILLSAFLDGELSEKERAQVSALLATSQEAAHYLQNLRNVRSVLQLLPERKVPHNYTLTRLEAQAAKPGRIFNLMRILSGVSAAVLAIVLAFDFLLPFQAAPMVARKMEDFALEEMPMAESAPADMEKSEPSVFNWFPAAPPGFGVGGGGGGDGVPVPQDGNILPDMTLKPGEALPAPAPTAAEEEMLESAEAPMVMEAEEGLDREKGELDSGPILGIQPEELQGQTIGDAIEMPVPIQELPEVSRQIPYRTIEISLLIVSVLTALTAFILRKQK